MATYSTTADPFIDAVEAGAAAGAHGPSYNPTSFGNTPKAQVAAIELIFAELASAIVDNGSFTASQVSTALKTNGERIIGKAQQAVGDSPQPGLKGLSATGGTGGITTAAGTEASPADMTLAGTFEIGSTISVRVVTNLPSDDVVIVTIASQSTATAAATTFSAAINTLAAVTSTSSGAVIDVLKATAGTITLSEFDIRP